MEKNLTLEYWLDDGWFVGWLKDIPSVFSQGETLAELEANIQEVYQLLKEEVPGVPTLTLKTKEICVQV